MHTISPITRFTKSGLGRLTPIPPAEGEFDVEYKIHVETWLKEVRSGLPPVTKARATISTMKRIDGGYIPEGLYRLQAENETMRVQNLGLSWHLLSER
jgi:hypothetical protein